MLHEIWGAQNMIARAAVCTKHTNRPVTLGVDRYLLLGAFGSMGFGGSFTPHLAQAVVDLHLEPWGMGLQLQTDMAVQVTHKAAAHVGLRQVIQLDAGALTCDVTDRVNLSTFDPLERISCWTCSKEYSTKDTGRCPTPRRSPKHFFQPTASRRMEQGMTSLAHCLLMEGGVTISVPAVHAEVPRFTLDLIFDPGSKSGGRGRCSTSAMLSTVLPRPCTGTHSYQDAVLDSSPEDRCGR